MEIAKDADMSVATLAQAFCKSRWYIPSSIIGATTLAQLKENVRHPGTVARCISVLWTITISYLVLSHLFLFHALKTAANLFSLNLRPLCNLCCRSMLLRSTWMRRR